MIIKMLAPKADSNHFKWQDEMKKNKHGGVREGSGAPKKPEWLKKVPCPLTLPKWLKGKLDGLPRSRAVEIEELLLEKFGWKPPE